MPITPDEEFDDFFNLPKKPQSKQFTTIDTPNDRVVTDITTTEDYDIKDVELEASDQEIYDLSLEAFKEIKEIVPDIEPKFRARLLEVANSLLQTALAANKNKRDHKKHKDVLRSKPTKMIDVLNGQGNVVGNRNELLEEMRKLSKQAEIIDDKETE